MVKSASDNNKNFIALVSGMVDKFFCYLESNLFSTLCFMFVVSLAIRVAVTPFGRVLREDAFIYLAKSLEITKGDFVPSLSYPIGWSLFMAPFFLIFKSASILKNMHFARLLSDMVGALAIFPFYLLAKEIMPRRALILALMLFTFCSQLIISATSAYSEPLFTVLLLFSLLFVSESRQKRSGIFNAAFFAGLCYWVRTNGIFVLVLVIVSAIYLRHEIAGFRYADIGLVIVIFLITSAPHLYLRYHYFGSPTYYGSNSKFFVDTFAKVWSNNIGVPSLLDYLKTHTPGDWINRFLVHGFFELIFYDFIYKTLTPLLTFPFLYGVIRYMKRKELFPLLATMAIWIAGLSPVWAIFDNPRHFYPLMPLVLIFTALAIYDMFRNHRLRALLQALFILVFVGFSLVTPVKDLVSPEEAWAEDGMTWAKWVAEHVRGKIAIIEGGDLIMMNLPDTRVGGVGQYDLYAPKSGLSIVRPGYFSNLHDAMKWLEKAGVTHIVLDDINIDRRPYLRSLLSGNKTPPYLVKLYDNHNTSSKWKVRIFAINWDVFERYDKLKEPRTHSAGSGTRSDVPGAK